MHLDLTWGLVVYIKWPILVLFAFCQKTHPIRKFSIALHSQPFEIFVLFSPFIASRSKNSLAVQMKFDLLADLVA